MQTVVAIYLAGALAALLLADGGPGTKLALALAWPLGVLAMAVTLTLLVGAALVLFPTLGVTFLIVAVVSWWLLA